MINYTGNGSSCALSRSLISVVQSGVACGCCLCSSVAAAGLPSHPSQARSSNHAQHHRILSNPTAHRSAHSQNSQPR